MGRREQDPRQKSRREAFEHSDAFGLAVTRLLIGDVMKKPSERETRETLEWITSEILNPTLKVYTSVDQLKKFKEITSKHFGYPLSAPHLSSSIISLIAGDLRSEATEDFKNREIPSIPIKLICAYDVNVGIMRVVSAIEYAENAIRETSDNALGRSISERLAGVASLSDQTNLFLSKKRKALEYSKFLKEDPTGKSLIRYAVEETENPQSELSPNLREFVVHGARFAQNAYGIIYPIAERINEK